MKKLSLLLATMAVLLPSIAHGYSSQAGVDPSTSAEIETKAVRQATSATTALAAGLILSYTNANDGYTITKAGAASAVGSRLIACVSSVNGVGIASAGVTSPCVVKGLVRGVSYDTSGDNRDISRGEPVCANSSGKAVNCAAAASESRVISLNLAPAGGTGLIDVLVNTQ